MSFNDHGQFEESERQEIVVVDRQVCAGQSQEVAVCRLGSSVLRRKAYNMITYISSCYVIAFNHQLVRFSLELWWASSIISITDADSSHLTSVLYHPK